MDEKTIKTASIEHQNNLIINNSTNNNNKENDSSIAGSEILIISDSGNKENTEKKEYHQRQRKSSINNNNKNTENLKLSKENYNNNNNEKTVSPSSIKTSQNSSTHKFIPLKNFKTNIPFNILMGSIQLILAIILVALGCLVLAREASLSYGGSGLWSGAICAIAGSLGIMNIQKAQTAFLAMSLVCVASSTLGIAITGIGVVRDSNMISQDKSVSAITAGSGLLFILTVHFFVSVFSVYHSTLKICARQFPIEDQENPITIANSSVLSQKKVEEYIKSLTEQQKQGIYNNATVISNEKPGINFPFKTIDKRASWIGVDGLSNLTYPGQGHYPVMLVPAGNNGKQIKMMPIYPPAFLPPPGLMQRDVVIPPPINGFPHMQFYDRSFQRKHVKHSRSSQQNEINKHNTNADYHRRQRRTTKRRRKSEGDILNNRDAFLYKGLDRAIAEDFLAQQEKHNQHNSIMMEENKSCYGSKKDVIL